ncbi:MAG: alpha/beta hydrolase [Candidatus Pacebacteria bacterium]|nr:alpha/beta hydrolase [Candidatus Paceibacterota bacterium]
MQFNSIVFPHPRASYTSAELYGNLIYIPRDSEQWTITAPFVSFSLAANIRDKQSALRPCGSFTGPCVPCLFLPTKRQTTKILIHFHGNAEDVGQARKLLKTIRHELHVHVIAVEYRGYGVYREGEPAADSLLEDADLVYRYITTVLHFSPEDVIVFGRSIGSGPSCYLASKYSLHSLVLMSGFTSLREVAKGFVGSVLQFLVAERFENKEWLGSARCPVFIVHGRRDHLVPPKHALALRDAVKSQVKLHMPEDMDHNSFSFLQDFIYPLLQFYEEQGLSVDYRLKESATNTTGSGSSRSECGAEGELESPGAAVKFYIPIKSFNRPTK